MFPQTYIVRGYSQKRGVHIVRNYVSNKFILTPPVQYISQNLSSSTKCFDFTSIHMFNVSNIVASWSSTHTYQNNYVGLKPEIMTYGALYIIKKTIWLLKYFLITNLLFCNGEFMDKLLSHHHSALTHGFIGLGKKNYKAMRETFTFWNLVHLIEVWRKQPFGKKHLDRIQTTWIVLICRGRDQIR